MLLKRNLVTLELRHVEINISSSGRIIQLAKTKAITHFLAHATAFSGSHFSHATQKLENSNMSYCKTKNPVELKHFKTPSFYRVYNLMKIKHQKENQFLISEYGYVTWKNVCTRCGPSFLQEFGEWPQNVAKSAGKLWLSKLLILFDRQLNMCFFYEFRQTGSSKGN